MPGPTGVTAGPDPALLQEPTKVVSQDPVRVLFKVTWGVSARATTGLAAPLTTSGNHPFGEPTPPKALIFPRSGSKPTVVNRGPC